MPGAHQGPILGIGTDIVTVSRVADAIQRHGQRFLNRVFSPDEQAYCQSQGAASARHYAGRWAAKEAVAKALGSGFGQDLAWSDVEVAKDPRGKPLILLKESVSKAFGVGEVMVSLSHCDEYATAMVILFSC